MTNYSQRYASGDSNTAGSFYFDTISTVDYPASKVLWGAEGAVNHASAATPLPVTAVITGTVTVGAHAVTNAGTFAVQAAQSGTWTVQPGNTANTTAWLVTGTGGTFPVTDSGGSLTVDAPVGTPVFVRLSDGASAISTLPVSLASVPSHAVTNVGVFVVQENGAALTALQLIDNLVLAEDAAHVSGDPGVQMLAVQKTADGALAGTTGDYAPLQVDDNGYLKVNIKAGAGSGGTSSTDDGAFTAASGSGTPMMGFVTADSVDSGDVGVVGMLANRQLKVTLYDSAGAELSVGGGTQYTEDAAAAANPVGNALIVIREDGRGGGLVTADGDNVALRGNNFGELYVKHTDSIAVTYATTGAGTATGAIRVELPTNGTGTIATVGAVTAITNALPAGTNAIGKLASNTGVTIGAVEIAAAQTLATVTTVSTLTGGGVAHDSADSGNPHKVGAKATTALSGVTLVADADRTDNRSAVDGALLVRGVCLEDVVQERTTNTDGASTAFASGLAAPGAGVRLWITNVTIANSSASFCTVDLRDGSGGSVLWTVPVPATGGAVVRFDPPLKLSANTALAFDASAATTTLSISANGFKSKI